MIDTDKLKLALQTPAGEEIRHFLIMKIKEMDSLGAIEEKDHPLSQAVEFQAQKKSLHFLLGIYRDLLGISKSDIISEDSYNPE